MKRFFVIILLFLTACRSYPNGQSLPQKSSFRTGDIQVWQQNMRPMLIDSLGLVDLFSSEPKPKQKFEVSVEPIDLSSAQSQKLKDLLQPFESATLSQNRCQTEPATLFYLQKGGALQIADCENWSVITTQSVTLIDVRLVAKDGVTLQAYLFVPALKANDSANQPVSTAVYWHGHESGREEAAFDFSSYHKAIGYQMAKSGMLTLVPTIRTFEKGNKEHYRLTKKQFTPENPLFAKFVEDAYLWGQWLQYADLKTVGLDQDLLRGLAQVAGTSLGSQIALWVGALDLHYSAVTSVGGFYGFEVLYSKFHHLCQHVPKMMGEANIMDVALLIWPRHLHLGMGVQDKFYNDYAQTALDTLQNQVVELGGKVCAGLPSEMADQMRIEPRCELSVELDPKAGHELTTLISVFQILNEQKP